MLVKLVFRNLWGRKRRSLLSMLCISVVVIFIFGILQLYFAFQSMLREDAYDAHGEYNLLLVNADADLVRKIMTDYASCTEIGFERTLGQTRDDVWVYQDDPKAASMNRYRITEGSLPGQGEIAITLSARQDGEIIQKASKPGDEIVLLNTKYHISGYINEFDFGSGGLGSYAVTLADITEGDADHCYVRVRDRETYNDLIDLLSQKYPSEAFFDGSKKEGLEGGYTVISNQSVNDVVLFDKGSFADLRIGKLLLILLAVALVTSGLLTYLVFRSHFVDRREQTSILRSLGLPSMYGRVCSVVEGLLIIMLGGAFGFLFGTLLVKGMIGIVQRLRMSQLMNLPEQIFGTAVIYAIILILACFSIPLFLTLFRDRKLDITQMYFGMDTEISRHRRSYRKDRASTWKYLLTDQRVFEVVCVGAALILSAMVCMLVAYLGRYSDYQEKNRDVYESEFDLIFSDNDDVRFLEEKAPDCEMFGVIHDNTVYGQIPKEIAKEKYRDQLYDASGTCFIEVACMNEAYYNYKIETEIPYEEFVRNGSALLIDNYMDTREDMLYEIPDTISVRGTNVTSDTWDSIPIAGKAVFRNWNEQSGISLILPEKQYRELGLTNDVVFARVNAVQGKELQLAEWLGENSFKYEYSMHDNATAYLRQKDNQTTIHIFLYGAALFIVGINILILVYMQKLILQRKKGSLETLRMLGHPAGAVLLRILLIMLLEAVVALVIAFLLITMLMHGTALSNVQEAVSGQDRFVIASAVFAGLCLTQAATGYISGKRMLRYR